MPSRAYFVEKSNPTPHVVSTCYFDLYEWVNATYASDPEPVRRFIFAAAYTNYSRKKKIDVRNALQRSSGPKLSLALNEIHTTSSGEDSFKSYCDEAQELLYEAVGELVKDGALETIITHRNMISEIRTNTSTSISEVKNYSTSTKSDISRIEVALREVGVEVKKSDEWRIKKVFHEVVIKLLETVFIAVIFVLIDSTKQFWWEFIKAVFHKIFGH